MRDLNKVQEGTYFVEDSARVVYVAIPEIRASWDLYKIPKAVSHQADVIYTYDVDYHTLVEIKNKQGPSGSSKYHLKQLVDLVGVVGVDPYEPLHRPTLWEHLGC